VKLRLGTRGSRLALAQTRSVADALAALGLDVDVIPIKTSGDHLAQVALGDFGGKALFVKEIEEALLEGRIDVGIHSLKDMPTVLPAGLSLAAFPPREDPRDSLVSRRGGGLGDLPPAAVVGTSTRLAKLESGAYDALVVARAGLDRLGQAPAHATVLPAEEFLPAVGQGILGLEVREDDRETQELLGRLEHPGTRMQAEAERAFLRRLGADCHTPVAGYARLDGDALNVTGLVASPDGATVLRSSISGLASAAEALGEKVADELLARGARRLLDAGGDQP